MDARIPDLSPQSTPPAVAEDRLHGSGWRAERGEPSLAGMFGSVRTAKQGPFWRKLLAFLGPGYLVAVGYMDPGNWATSLAGGSRFGYALLSVALLSNVMAIVLQSLCTRLGVGAGRDLAQACRDSYPRWVSLPLWLSAEIAITATDLAEVIGTAIGLNLLFHIPLEIGVIITAADVFLILALQAFGFRWIEAFVVAMLGVIAACFGIQIAMADPDWGAVIKGFAPDSDILRNREMLYLALGILGATVMPHNLYLHSGLVQTRDYGDSTQEKREAIKLATIDSSIALCLALVINASILILAAATLSPHRPYRRLRRGSSTKARTTPGAALLGSTTLAPDAVCDRAVMLRAQLSTITATLSGQIVMEGFLNLRIAPWLRRMVTRMIAIVPAVVVTIWAGGKATGQLLIFSQVVLSLQLPFAVVPLVMFTASRSKMGAFVAPRWLTVLAALTAAVIIALNAKLVWDYLAG